MRIAERHAPEGSYRSYLVARLERSIQLAERSKNAAERAAHLRACRHYCELLGNAHLR